MALGTPTDSPLAAGRSAVSGFSGMFPGATSGLAQALAQAALQRQVEAAAYASQFPGASGLGVAVGQAQAPAFAGPSGLGEAVASATRERMSGPSGITRAVERASGARGLRNSGPSGLGRAVEQALRQRLAGPSGLGQAVASAASAPPSLPPQRIPGATFPASPAPTSAPVNSIGGTATRAIPGLGNVTPTGPVSIAGARPVIPTGAFSTFSGTLNPAAANASKAAGNLFNFMGAPAQAATQNAVQATGRTTLGSRLAGALGGGPLAGKSTFMRSIAPVAGTMIGGTLWDNTVGEKDGVWDDVLAGALGGAAGGAIGFGLPGALIGGVGGGVWGAITGGDSSETKLKNSIESNTEKFNEGLSGLKLSPELSSLARQQFNAMLSQAESPSEADAVRQQVMSMVMQALPSDLASQEDRRRREAMAAAMQAWMGPQMQQVITQQDFYANQQADILNELAGNFSSPALSNAARAMAAQVPLNTSQQALATLNQIALTPGMYGFSADGTAVSGPFADPNAVGSAQPMLDPLVALLAGQTAGQAAAQ